MPRIVDNKILWDDEYEAFKAYLRDELTDVEWNRCVLKVGAGKIFDDEKIGRKGNPDYRELSSPYPELVAKSKQLLIVWLSKLVHTQFRVISLQKKELELIRSDNSWAEV